MNTIQTLFDSWSMDTLLSIFLLLFALREIWNIFNWFLEILGIQTKWSLQKKYDKDMILRHEEKLNDISSYVHTTKDKINVLGQMILDMQDKADATERARLKDRISQSYRIYHEKGEWTYMEKESFGDLIRDYEAHGGKNSFVHETCEPESNLWKVTNHAASDE